MRNKSPKQWRAVFKQSLLLSVAALLSGLPLHASPTVTTVGGGQPPLFYGYRDGATLTSALFHTPCGLAIDNGGTYLFVADRDNNAIRYLDLAQSQTWTFAITKTNLVNKPVGVLVDASLNVYVLNRGTGNNGTLVKFDNFGDVVTTNATALTNACGFTMDISGNLYVTVRSNTVLKITPAGVKTNLVIIPTAGTSLQGIIAKHNGMLAVCDAGRNGIYLIDPTTGTVTTNAGFHGVGDFTTNGNNVASPTTAKFNQPTSLTEAGDGTLIVTDYGNNRVKVVLASGVVTNLYGISSGFWGPVQYPGWYDGVPKTPDSAAPNAQSRLPFGIVFAPDGTVYTSEDYYHLIRKVTGTGLTLPPPPPPQVPTPQIGWVEFPATSTPFPYTSVFHAVSSFVFNNDAPIVIIGANGSQTFYTFSNTPTLGLVPDPTSASFSAPSGYQDGLLPVQVNALAVAGIAPYVAIKAIGEKNDGSPNSGIAQALFQFVVGNPTISGNNPAQFTVSDITTNALIYYTIDGTEPTNHAPSIGPITNGTTLSIISSTNFTFKVRAFRANYQASATVTAAFSIANTVANTISFGFDAGEASSDFVASPGQTFYAPVTMSILPGTVMYSLQFNLTVTNLGPNPITSGAFGFNSFLEKPIPGITPVIYTTIPPAMFAGGGNYTNGVFTNNSQNLLGVGWLERAGKTNLYDTTKQTLITFSQVHDVQYLSSGGQIEVGGYGFSVPLSAGSGDSYRIQIGRPSATSDGIGGPGADVFISAPTNGSLGAGAVNSIKVVTVGQRKYIAGDVTPFRWFNAGDFGKGYLNNADVEQVFQSAIYSLNTPPSKTDFFDAMDSCGNTYVDNGNGYLENSGVAASTAVLFDGDDTTINQVAFGDGTGFLDVCDVYVTFRRSLDSSLTLFRRFWTNGVRVAEKVPNVTPHGVLKAGSVQLKANITPGSTNSPQVNFSASNIVASAGQTVFQIPITAQIFGNYPLRVLMLNLTVVPLDGSPALTTAVSFTPSAALGTPSLTDSIALGNYAASWLNSAITGLSNNATIGTLTVTIPANASANAAYAIHFDHASGSPNGLASFPKQLFTGLITLSNRTNSCFGDGIPDAWRLRWFGTTNNLLSVSNACPTGDGVNNWKKYFAGVDPTIANDFPSVNPKTPVTSGFTAAIHWPTVSGKKYAIERSASLFSGSWTSLSTNIGTGGNLEYNDTNTNKVKFYRVRILP
jgi:hypothetical protein